MSKEALPNFAKGDEFMNRENYFFINKGVTFLSTLLLYQGHLPPRQEGDNTFRYPAVEPHRPPSPLFPPPPEFFLPNNENTLFWLLGDIAIFLNVLLVTLTS